MIYILLPVYNEAGSIILLLKKIKTVMDNGGFSYRIIIVNDGSVDNTGEILKNNKSDFPLDIICHKINRGLGETARDAFEAAAEAGSDKDIIIRMDGDNTHDPKYIPGMVKKLEEGYDVVIASRFENGGGMIGVNAYRTFVSYLASLVMKICFPIKGVKDYSCGFRAYRLQIIKDAIKVFGNNFIELKGLGFTSTIEKLVKLRMFGAKMAEVPFRLRYDQKIGESKMVVSVTTLGYVILIVKNIYPWGAGKRDWKKKIKKLQNVRNLRNI